MIKKVSPQKKDKLHLLKNKKQKPSEIQRHDYRNVIVQKPWGYEYLIFDNKAIGIWILHIQKGQSTSVHCHPHKKTSLIILSGQAIVHTLEDEYKLDHMDGMMYDKGVFHSTSALTHDVFVMEIETPNYKTDLFRLKDNYGRQNLGYETKNYFTNATDICEYFTFSEVDVAKSAKRVIKNNSISFEKRSFDSFGNHENAQNSQKLFCLLDHDDIPLSHSLHTFKSLIKKDEELNDTLILTIERL
jgi:mannose-6-phosphate isomerase-like protein (cupin superfamily)